MKALIGFYFGNRYLGEIAQDIGERAEVSVQDIDSAKQTLKRHMEVLDRENINYLMSQHATHKVLKIFDPSHNNELVKIVKLTTKEGYSWKTRVNPLTSDEETNEYFLNYWFDVEPFPSEKKDQVVKVEIEMIQLEEKKKHESCLG